ncbi:hypothetical protein [Sphingorhabdus sp.]|jgi:hypothetical protein|uniref:hypothetical protein n=1 Tax=Sphingorhabdus sp. TaxID=1902408 RepID=UPI002D0B562F|nr:hypothetical protein [Sphingorhabdus sp.]HMT42157.1 hypothetical protein [Sphingorhabdus sp.]
MKKLTLLFATAMIASCGSEPTTTVTTSDGKSVELTQNGQNEATVKAEDGTTATFSTGAAAAKDLPLGIPAYPGAAVTANISGNRPDGKGGAMVTMTTPDAPDKVTAFYKAEATKRGMTTKSQETAAGNMASFSAENEAGEKLVATATPGGEGKTQVMLVIETK